MAAAVYGGVGMGPQEHAFRSGVNVIVATPGRLLDHLKQSYAKLDDQGKNLRIRYWHCGENQNNAVFQTQEGTTQFDDFTFTEQDNTTQGAKP